MAHFALLNESNLVTQVIVLANEELLIDGVENETKGINFLKNLYGEDTNWVQTSYNGSFRGNFAGIGFLYDPVNDYFISPSPYASWILNIETAQWEAPIAKPNDNKLYEWHEDTQEWVEHIPPISE